MARFLWSWLSFVFCCGWTLSSTEKDFIKYDLHIRNRDLSAKNSPFQSLFYHVPPLESENFQLENIGRPSPLPIPSLESNKNSFSSPFSPDRLPPLDNLFKGIYFSSTKLTMVTKKERRKVNVCFLTKLNLQLELS